MLKNLLGQILGSIANNQNPGGRVFVVRNRGGGFDALELFGPAQNWDRGAIVDWSKDSDELYGFSGDPDGDGIEDWKGQGWACGFVANNSADAIDRAKTGNFQTLPAWFPNQA